MRVADIMTRTVRACTPDDTLDSAAHIMWEEDCGCVPVVRPGDGDRPQLVGMLTDRDICMAAYTTGQPLTALRVAWAMEREVASCVPADPIAVALTVLSTKKVRRLPVVEGDGYLVGLLSLADVARYAAHVPSESAGDFTAEAIARTVEAICEPRQMPRDVVPC